MVEWCFPYRSDFCHERLRLVYWWVLGVCQYKFQCSGRQDQVQHQVLVRRGSGHQPLHGTSKYVVCSFERLRQQREQANFDEFWVRSELHRLLGRRIHDEWPLGALLRGKVDRFSVSLRHAPWDQIRQIPIGIR